MTPEKQFEIKCWAVFYNVYKFIAENGELLAFENYPTPVVNYFSNWIKNNKKQRYA